MASGDVWRVSLVYSHAGTELAVMTMHFKEISASAEFASLCSVLKANLTDLLKTKQASTLRLDEMRGLTENVSPPLAEVWTTGLPTVGSIATDELPHQVAMVVTHKTAYAGRSYRGRHFIPGLTETETAAGLFDNTTTDAIQAYYDDLIALVGQGGSNTDWQWVVWSERLQTATTVVDTVCRNIPGIIRRRRVGVGV